MGLDAEQALHLAQLLTNHAHAAGARSEQLAQAVKRALSGESEFARTPDPSVDSP